MTTAIGAYGVDPSLSAPRSSADTMSALGGLDGQAFLKLLVAQLRYQSPLEPSDPTQLMMTTSQLAQLDAIQTLADLQRRDIGLQQAVAATGLLGADVTAVSEDGVTFNGTVDRIRYTHAGPVLAIADREVPLGSVLEVSRNA